MCPALAVSLQSAYYKYLQKGEMKDLCEASMECVALVADPMTQWAVVTIARRPYLS